MYEINYSKKFKKAYKKLVRSGKFDQDEYARVVNFLTDGVELPSKYYDHALKGNLLGQRECHIMSDTLLLYEIDSNNRIITLAKIGNHAQVFKS